MTGDCTNGAGTLRTADGTEYTGTWKGGRYRKGVPYQARYRLDPSRTFELIFDDEGFLLEGTVLRGDYDDLLGEYSGTFQKVVHDSTGDKLLVYKNGRYINHATGHVYIGEFSYISAVRGGHYVFQGVRIDEESNEAIQGLFVSDATTRNSNLAFRRARPDYLLKLQQDIAAEKSQMAANESQNAKNNMAFVLNIMGGLWNVGGSASTIRSLQRESLETLTQGVLGNTNSTNIKDLLISQVVKHAGLDPALAKVIGDVSDAGNVLAKLTSANAKNQPQEIIEYAMKASGLNAMVIEKVGVKFPTTKNEIIDAITGAAFNQVKNSVNTAEASGGKNPVIGKVVKNVINLSGQIQFAVPPDKQETRSKSPSNALPQPKGGSGCELGSPTAGSGWSISSVPGSSVPLACYKDRLATFGDANSSRDDACRGARRDDDIRMFKGKNLSSCYCTSPAKLNGLAVNHLCYIFFDGG
ncbi:hypothetical protein [Rhodoferax saidenbachensis]|uniref:Uncharacterized protein n=1 Tax=Rhodoferax saidenbachensis TaxID=1484693 RepID=A0A1P8KER8_9BURK|nr:hypothetical protein [Rhodoferax saidenbachensis]APW44527.1 hypothetical protein RS694_19720 [Rhodoferax saidenbachensis]